MSGEAAFLERLARESTSWLDALEHELDALEPSRGLAACESVAGVWAVTLAERPALCELLSVVSSVLECDISAEALRMFKRGTIARNLRLARLVAHRIPELRQEAALEVASMASAFIAGLWPLANREPTVLAATEDPALPTAHVDFPARTARLLALLLSAEILTDPRARLPRPAAP